MAQAARAGAQGRGSVPDDSWRGVEPDAARRLLVAAVEAFAERGFHATTTRDIAGRAGMSPAALYIHYRTKEELLYQISRVGHERSVRLLSDAASGEGRHADRLAAAVRTFVRWHAEHHTTARVVQYELHALGEEHYAEIVALRRRSETVVRDLLADGALAGEFDVADPRGTALAVLSLCVDVARWFTPGGRRTPDEIGAFYAGLALRMVGAPPAAPA
ncbi:TetR/AcrR family transcriptional regulator [Streptomyces sp. TRM 70351]|uniref:TetR/AcrR family transcriptional regulator n=1 Tax=Streptomyces sp. TRM 70351 TaxID=3116552 RepID=UPI002E7C3DA8|nr:TetR/AcrR family transcriptional regulator [Streptomyces sp. TRM 70351]MEE1929233.1 TetR/AcrR family transcriptional regulator [Streptomyces sp. TRM 70351]